MTHYFWYSKDTASSLEKIIEDNGPQADYYGYPLIYPVNVAQLDNGKLIRYTAVTDRPHKSTGSRKDVILVARSEDYEDLVTIEGVTPAGKNFAVRNQIQTAASLGMSVGRAIIEMADTPNNKGRNNPGPSGKQGGPGPVPPGL